MEKTAEKEISDVLTWDIIQSYLKHAEKKNIVVIQNGEQEYVKSICQTLEQHAKKKGKIVQRIDAVNLQTLIEPPDGTLLIINDPEAKIRYNGRMQEKAYHVDLNELIRIFHNSHRSGGVYRRPSSDPNY